MPDEVGTEATRSDAPGGDDALFGEAADDKTAAAADEQDSDAENAQEQEASGDTEEQAADGKAEQDSQGSEDGGDEAASTDDLKVVVSIKGGRTTIGVQQPSADPHIETFDADDLTGLAQELVSVIERARSKWEGSPKHPDYERPAPPARRRNRRQQGSAQGAATTDAETRAAEAQQQTLRLF